MRLLIVEDSPLVQQMYGLAFSRREHVLTTANDGREALAQLADPASHFDVILLDLRMPGMNGVDFLREVRRDPRLAQLPIVVTTMEPEDSALLREARGLGVAAVVKKPWHPHQLRDLVEAIIHGGG
jgi:CheY-like chemotaxis protein